MELSQTPQLIPRMLPESAESFRASLLKWSENNLRKFPWREPDADLYEVFIAELFLTQTPAENVAEHYPHFLEEYPDLSSLELATEKELADVIRPLGFQNRRSSALSSIGNSIGEMPRDPDGLMDLPRVGRYIANATLCFALDRSIPILDRNVERIYGRVFREDWPSSPSERWEFTKRMLPEDGAQARQYNLALLDFGSILCKPRSPDCGNCWAREMCTAFQEGSV